MNEYLLNNCIENDLQNFLYPLNLLNFIVYSPKYCISDNFITPNNRKTKWRSFYCVSSYVVIFMISLVFHADLKYYEGTILFLFIIIYFVTGGSFIINLFVTILQSDMHVNFIIIIQNTQNLFNYVKIDFKSFLIGNWIYFFVVFFSYIFMISTHLYEGNFTVILFMYYAGLILLDFNVIYLFRLVDLLTHIIFTWISELKHVKNKTKTDSKVSKSYNMLKKAYLNIINAANVYEEMAKIPMIFHMTGDLFNVLLHVEVILMYPEDFWSNVIIGLIWTFKIFLLLFIISFKTEKFFTTLKKTQVMFLIPGKARTLDERLLHKTVIRAGNAASVGRESGAFALGATLPLNFLSCIATYVVVLLQFKLT